MKQPTKPSAEIKGRVTVEAELFARYKKLAAEKSALEKEVKNVLSQMNLPEASPETLGAYIIENGNHDEIGKVSIFHRDSFVMPECNIRKVS